MAPSGGQWLVARTAAQGVQRQCSSGLVDRDSSFRAVPFSLKGKTPLFIGSWLLSYPGEPVFIIDVEELFRHHQAHAVPLADCLVNADLHVFLLCDGAFHRRKAPRVLDEQFSQALTKDYDNS